MRLVFAGTGAFSVPTLRRLHESGHELALVVTQPDRPAGRGLRLRSSPVKEAAVGLALELFQPSRVRDQDAVERIQAARRLDGPDQVGTVAGVKGVAWSALLSARERALQHLHPGLAQRDPAARLAAESPDPTVDFGRGQVLVEVAIRR